MGYIWECEARDKWKFWIATPLYLSAVILSYSSRAMIIVLGYILKTIIFLVVNLGPSNIF